MGYYVDFQKTTPEYQQYSTLFCSFVFKFMSECASPPQPVKLLALKFGFALIVKKQVIVSSLQTIQCL